MFITKHKIDEFNSVISLSIFEEDYSKIVKKIIKKYRKKTFLPGFRKGRVPKEFIREIYEEKLTNYEVKKILKKVIQASIYREDILGKAITLGANRKSKYFFFKFYITFPPKFKIYIEKINTPYKILLEEKEVYKKIKSIQRKFGISSYKRMDNKKIGKYRTLNDPKKYAHELNSEISEILLSSYDSKIYDYLYNDILLEKLVEKTLFKFPKDFIHRYMNSYYTEYMNNKDKYLNKKKEIEHFFRFQLIENKLVNYLKIFQIFRKKRKKFLRLDEFQSLDFFFRNAYFN